MHDNLGDRIKANYENRTKTFLPRRTYTVLRVDGRSFSNFTRSAKKPYDKDIASAMNKAVEALCSEIDGSIMGYTQSDEISVVAYDFAKNATCAWFDGNVQKMCSVAASIATASFNEHIRKTEFKPDRLAQFDCRVFTIPDPVEVENYMVWRQQDCVRNSVSSLARTLYSHKELHQKNVPTMMEMVDSKGSSWESQEDAFKFGRLCAKRQQEEQVSFKNKDGEIERRLINKSFWSTTPAPDLKKDRHLISSLIPKYENS